MRRLITLLRPRRSPERRRGLLELGDGGGELQEEAVPTKIVLIDDLWTPENDMLTAVQKLKRREIVAKHQSEIDKVYPPEK